MNPDSLDEAKQHLRIPELWRMLGLPGEAAKSCRSPFREDTNPSFSVFDDGRKFKDHATGESGDAIDFLARARNLSLAEWRQYFGSETAYHRTCREWPSGTGAPRDGSDATEGGAAKQCDAAQPT